MVASLQPDDPYRPRVIGSALHRQGCDCGVCDGSGVGLGAEVVVWGWEEPQGKADKLQAWVSLWKNIGLASLADALQTLAEAPWPEATGEEAL